MSFQVAYVPIGVGTFHLESAQDQFEKSIAMLKGLNADCTVPEKMLLTINDLDAYLDTLNPDLIVLQNITFANAAYASEVLKRFTCPIVLWTLREPVIDGTRLRLNSLTGAYSAGNAITAFRGEGKFEYIFGAPGEDEVVKEVGAAIRAAKVKYDLRRLKMISIGHTPQGFGFGRALDAEMMSTFGTTLDSIEARELINKAKGYTEDELADELAEARKTIVGLETIPENNVVNFARLYKAYKSYVGENHIGALCSRCWPDFFTEFGTPVCSVLSLLNANGVSASCESDAYGALSMFIGSALTSDYIKVFEMWEVHEKVISALDLDYTYTQMDNMLSVTNANDTRMLDITVTDADPEEAAAIANEYAEVGASYIAEKMKTDEPTIMSSARVPANPFSPSKTKNILLGFLAGFVLACGVVVLRVLLDDTYKSAEEIRKYTGMVVLASVPLVGGTEPKKGSNFQRRMKRLSKDICRRVGGKAGRNA